MWREEGEVRRRWRRGVEKGSIGGWGGRKVDRILRKRKVEMRLETGKMLEDDWWRKLFFELRW